MLRPADSFLRKLMKMNPIILFPRRSLIPNVLQIIRNRSYSSNAEVEATRKAQILGKGLPKRKEIPGVRSVVLVASGKGGVGKSTVAVNLAVGTKLQYPQKAVGLLDADIFGPSLPLMMGLDGEPELNSDNLMIPLQNHGIHCMSMGFLINPGSPIIWRGLMVMQAIERLVRGVQWGPLDILFVDMPPGTGDTQLSFAQTVVINGAVMVTTPQKVALQDALKGAEMFKKTNVPVLGFVLNMSSYICPKCGNQSELIADNGKKPSTKSILENYNSSGNSLLGEIPFEPQLSLCSDEGTPIVLAKPNSSQAKEFFSIAKKIVDKLEIESQHQTQTSDRS